MKTQQCVSVCMPSEIFSRLCSARNKGTAFGMIWSEAVSVRLSVQIFLVHYIEAPADSLSSNLSDLEEDYYLLLYAPFPPASNNTPYCDRRV